MAKRIKTPTTPTTLDNIACVDDAVRDACGVLELYLVSTLRRVEKGGLPKRGILREAAGIEQLIRSALAVSDNPGDAGCLRDWLVASAEPGLPDSTSVRRLVDAVNSLVEERHDFC